jgi:hypothetical protein
MKFTEHLKELESNNFKVEETVVENVLTAYVVTYSYAGKTLTESVNVTGLSKKTSAKRLEVLKKKLKEKIVTESTALVGTPQTDIIRNNYGNQLYPANFYTDITLAPPADIWAATLYMSKCDPSKVAAYIKELEDNMATFKQMGQLNRVGDSEIRLGLARLALSMCDHLGKYSSV